MMDIEQIRLEVSRINTIKGDPEKAHEVEDALQLAFIKYIAEHGPDDLAAMAREILETRSMKFSRWFT